jgi:hypothetical protein
MRTRTGLAGIGIVFGCVWVAACGNEQPTGLHVGSEPYYSVEELPGAEGDSGTEGTTTASDTTARGIGGFGSGN